MGKLNIRWKLVAYDILIFIFVNVALLVPYRAGKVAGFVTFLFHIIVSFLGVFASRFFGNIYKQVWRYGGIQCYIKLLAVDGIACVGILAAEFAISEILSISRVSLLLVLSASCLNLLLALTMRMMYRYAYKCGNSNSSLGRFLNMLLHVFAGFKTKKVSEEGENKIKIAIIGAGRVGVSLAEELLANSAASYIPRCFIDSNEEKANREIHGIPVLLENESTVDTLKKFEVQEVVFAIPDLDPNKKRAMCDRYLEAGFKIKVYDFPVMQTEGSKRHLREFDVEELLFRKSVKILDQKTVDYYKDKNILITGGGGSIGSELCRQLAKMKPRHIVILDVYENGAYDVQQELKIAYGNSFNISIEICSITNKKALERVFAKHSPQIVINAAAHKHVPLMENNCIEAVENNVFGTLNIIELCEEYKAERFMMVSTDKAVNPTNVMGATKRMCEMLVGCASANGNVKYSSTRFGNVLGSAGSVIPLFKKQIAHGGPVTITDKRIIRYFMTIPEASQLVLQSGAMADNGELFVLDMGEPVKIMALAESMIKMSGYNDIEIIETGLRPGEKLYEELLIKDETLMKTENSLIFIEKDEAVDRKLLKESLDLLREACKSGSEKAVKNVLKKVVPTYCAPEEINVNLEESVKSLRCEKLVNA